MIKIETIDKENYRTNQYFVVYNINKDIHTVNGTPEDIVKELYKMLKEYNEQ